MELLRIAVTSVIRGVVLGFALFGLFCVLVIGSHNNLPVKMPTPTDQPAGLECGITYDTESYYEGEQITITKICTPTP